MENKDIHTFGLLKEKIIERMQQSFPGINPSISEWKGQEIVNFQEELLQNVKTNISEKWFYNHLKSENKTLPRIDVLNLLSRYIGYVNWDDFKYKNSDHSSVATPTIRANHYFIFVPLLTLFILGICFIIFKIFTARDYKFVFYDADTKEPLTNSVIEVSVLLEGESPVSYLCKSDGSFKLKTGKANVRFVVQAPYYLTDTIFRVLDKFNRTEMVKLQPDNFALMVYYLSNKNVEDWKKRRNQLNSMISDSALIYQVYDKDVAGLELYNKWEFINKLTLPSRGLKSIEILDTKYQDNKISVIRFKQKESEK